ncbi:TetR/AcrR family transcriptional regulator, mexJK operon transcriptional repressor [Sinosporangium album]|uniref:TetR/AcrR family transcriptional regulator, mexJK operon transcriptional repressor n=2 Tax=Sinosporangium album TaxID=504805 RepID=A0A1G7ZIV3_9ACTN|nr:TetR/AcrR family transcriptional regulator, mexJK operon transcriptional repressor [Sinosporangium album]
MNAAEALFVADGYEYTSVDAIAARAEVSKRTLYNHFGDKQALFQAVFERANDALVATVRTAIDQELTEGRDLCDALTAFALRVVTGTFPSSDYVTYRRLTSQGGPASRSPETARNHPDRMIEECFAKLTAGGEMRAVAPRRATQHFTALTVLLALDTLGGDLANTVNKAEIRSIIAAGVDAFLRAYRSPPTSPPAIPEGHPDPRHDAAVGPPARAT